MQEQLEQLARGNAEISSLFRENEHLLEGLSDQDWIIYLDRDKTFGEEAAMRWLVSKYGPK